MKILLDTHCWLWMLVSPERFSDSSLAVIRDGGNTLLLSAASSWEIAVKHSLGKLPLPEPPSAYVPSRIRDTGVEPLFITHSHALRAGELAPHHRDPFDRLLIAQSQVEAIPLLTADRQLDAYDAELIWAQ
jgi:PIN domain nuclease of toxin-antitoxin system